MTRAIAANAKIEGCCSEPDPDTLVLLHRDLLPNADPSALPVFGDERWDLTHGIFEAHTQACSVIFTDCPDAFRTAVRRYVWELINHEAPQSIRSAGTDRLALSSVRSAFRILLPFLTWLDTRGVTSFDQVTNADLDRFLDDLIASESSHRTKATQLIEIRRLWCYRQRLPEFMRLPAAPPWDGDDTRDLLDTPRADRENATPRIHPDTLQPLLMWSLRFVEDFADDIIAAFATYQHLQQRDRPFRRKSNDPVGVTINAGRQGWLHPFITDWIGHQRDRGGELPGRQRPDGTWDVHWRHLSRVFSCSESAWEPNSRVRRLILESGLPIADDAYLDTPITGHLHGRPWHSGPISYTEAPRLAKMLVTACAVTIIYLSGMRPGELVNLERGCTEHDPVGDLWLLHGQQWKGAVGPDGQKLPQGAPRQDPGLSSHPWFEPSTSSNACTLTGCCSPSSSEPRAGSAVPSAAHRWPRPAACRTSPTPSARSSTGSTSTAPSTAIKTSKSPRTRLVQCHSHGSAERWPGTSSGVPADSSPARSSTATCTSESPWATPALTTPGSQTTTPSRIGFIALNSSPTGTNASPQVNTSAAPLRISIATALPPATTRSPVEC